jgi:hypothetical protein
MKKTWLLLGVIFLVGCGSGPSGADRQAIAELLKMPNDAATADSIRFSDWDATSYEEGGKTWKVVRVKYTGKKGGSGEAFTKDVLVRYSGTPEMPLDTLDNKAGDDWKKDAKSQKWNP